MALAEWFPGFDKEALTLKILLAQRAIEALRMVIIIEGLYPAVAGFYWEPAGDTFSCEELIPIFFAVGKPIFKIERRVCENFATICAGKAFRMEVLAHGLQTVLSFHFCRISSKVP